MKICMLLTDLYVFTAMKNDLMAKSTEVEALKSRNLELEEAQMRQEDSINAMKRQTKKICVRLFSHTSYFEDQKSSIMCKRSLDTL